MVAGNSYPGIKRAYGDGGFDGCKNLETIATFNNLTYMLPAAFRDCYKLNTTIPITAATSLIVPGYDTNQWV
ncbi:hypothetical protein FACS1894218_4400 [Bacilli bacterium]|nr:hypothetical protein FACS1894218_4400 [Bacilli bacterium]